ncbi:MFS transporter [Kitasatospora sp. GP82]|uniref:MFS transporter n=1 Tax=Kitasatospora sp. GP82 TaxID=3035089 RepID=UPI002473AAF7|nr:MFS transporter [Kitasatospora sp. GP82]MDH6125397.1 MFS family permease [Kitasatospora sp. GP82]
MSTALAEAPATPQTSGRRRWAVLAVVLFAAILDLLDATITNIAAPTIAADLNGADALVRWPGAGYALAMGVLLVVGGRLGDKFGRRRRTGAAAITTVYFHTSGGSTNAATHSLAVGAAATLACCALVWLLPRKARPQHR